MKVTNWFLLMLLDVLFMGSKLALLFSTIVKKLNE